MLQNVKLKRSLNLINFTLKLIERPELKIIDVHDHNMELPLAERTQINSQLLKAIVFFAPGFKTPSGRPGFYALGGVYRLRNHICQTYDKNRREIIALSRSQPWPR